MRKKPKSTTATSPIPMPCKVQEDNEQRPMVVTLYGATVDVETIEERWEDEDFWWRGDPVVRVTW